jgi:hypothetical protein
MSDGLSRGEHRLMIAGRLMSPPAEPEDVMARIKALPTDEAESLRSLVDWVEAYEHEEAGF